MSCIQEYLMSLVDEGKISDEELIELGYTEEAIKLLKGEEQN